MAGLVAAQPLDLPLLKNAQKLHLNRRRHVSNFIKEHRAGVGKFKLPGLGGQRPGEGPLFVSEEFAFH